MLAVIGMKNVVLMLKHLVYNIVQFNKVVINVRVIDEIMAVINVQEMEAMVQEMEVMVIVMPRIMAILTIEYELIKTKVKSYLCTFVVIWLNQISLSFFFSFV